MKVYVPEYFPEKEMPETCELIWMPHNVRESSFLSHTKDQEIRNYKSYYTSGGTKRVEYESKDMFHYHEYETIEEFFDDHPDECLIRINGYLFIRERE